MRSWLIVITLVAVCLQGSADTPPSKGVKESPPPLKIGYDSAQLNPYLEAKEWLVFSLDPLPWKLREAPDPFAVPASSLTGGKPAADPVDPPKPEEKIVVPPEKDFHDYEILGQVKVPMSPIMKGVITALDRAGQTWDGAVAGCFNPRHGIRVVVGGETYDLLICYECMSACLYRDGKKVGVIRLAGPNAPSPAVLNAILTKAGVKVIPAHQG